MPRFEEIVNRLQTSSVRPSGQAGESHSRQRVSALESPLSPLDRPPIGLVHVAATKSLISAANASGRSPCTECPARATVSTRAFG
jgi:hypothetical protein